MDSTKKRLVLIDGYSFLFRAYHSMPPLTNPYGVVVGAVYGYANMIIKLRQELKTSHLAVILDAGSKTFRNDIYKEYKANRPPAPEDLIPQFSLVREFSESLNINTIDQKGVEADDIIASLSKQAEKEDFEVTIISSDKDLTQLINEKVKIYDPMKQKIIGKNEVLERYGVEPSKMKDLLSLAGDSADNIPGVAGIGPKTAADLLNKYQSLAGIYENIEEITQKKRKETLQENKDNAFLSERLVTLKTDVIVPINSLDDLKIKEIDQEKISNFLNYHNFASLLNKLNIKASEKPRKLQKIYQLIDISHLKNAVLKKLSISSEIFIFFYLNKVILANFREIYYFDLKEEETLDLLAVNSCNNISKKLFLLEIADILAEKSIKKIFFDYKSFYREFFAQENVKINNIFDLSLSSYALNDKINLKLDKKTEFNEEKIKNLISEIDSKHKNDLKNLIKEKQFEIFYNLDLLFNDLILKMEKSGFLISQSKLLSLTDEFTKKIKNLSKTIFLLSGEEFNIASPKQLAEILFKKLKLESGKKNKKSKTLSTSVDVLQELSQSGHKIAEYVLEWRHFSKLKSTYTEALPKVINPITRRVHSNFLNTNTSTGRLSSNNPNLQNIPIRSKEGDKIREAFICDDNNLLISADYSQIELRLLAHIAGVKKLQEAFLENADIHSKTASEIFGVSNSQITEEHRRKAKTINFGIIYGMGSFGLANRLKITKSEAKDYIELYFSRYPEIKIYMENIVEFYKKNKFVETIIKRRLYIPQTGFFNERAVINAPLQGSSSDIIKIAMINLDKKIKKENLKIKLLLQVHDELIYEVPEDFVNDAKSIIKKEMEQVLKLSVPLIVSINQGKNWQEAH